MPKHVDLLRFIRLLQMIEMTDIGKTFIYARMKDVTFPKQIQLASGSVVWNKHDFIKWMEDQIRWHQDDLVLGRSQ